VDRLALRIEESIRPVLCVTLYIVISVFLMMHVERGHQGHQHGASAMIFVLLMLAKSRSRFTFVQHSLVCVGIGFAASLASQVLDGPDLSPLSPISCCHAISRRKRAPHTRLES
jgi:hypothetical protein